MKCFGEIIADEDIVTKKYVDDGLADKQDIFQVKTLPTPEASLEGNIYQYVGATNTNYTNGCFYECVEVTPATDPKTYEWKEIPLKSNLTSLTVEEVYDILI